jgi:hypothetical protein
MKFFVAEINHASRSYHTNVSSNHAVLQKGQIIPESSAFIIDDAFPKFKCVLPRKARVCLESLNSQMSLVIVECTICMKACPIGRLNSQ